MSRQRDERRFRQLYDRYYRAVHAYFRRRGCLPEDAQDLAQMTFLRVFRGMKDYREEAGWTYIARIAQNVWLNELRYRGAQRRGAETASLDDLTQLPPTSRLDQPGGETPRTPEAEALARERAELEDSRVRLLRSAIAALPPRMRRCLLMRLDGGLKYREIALAMRVSMDTVKALLYQARERLRDQLGGLGEDEIRALRGEDDG